MPLLTRQGEPSWSLEVIQLCPGKTYVPVGEVLGANSLKKGEKWEQGVWSKTVRPHTESESCQGTPDFAVFLHRH